MRSVNPRFSATAAKAIINPRRTANYPFEAGKSDIKDTYELDQLVDPDEERDEDEDVDIMLNI